MAELSTAAPFGDPREIDTASMKNKHILRASVAPDEMFTFRKGALVGIRPGEPVRLLEVVLDGEPQADLEIVGVYDDERGQIDPITDAGGNDEALDAYGKSIRVSVRDGDLGNFDTAAPGANQILAEHVGQPCYAKNDNTLWLTDDSGTLPFAGLVGAVNARGKVTLRNTWDIRQTWKNYGAAVGITPATIGIQSGTDTLASGTKLVAATITASSRIMVAMKDPGAGAITGFADLDVPVASRVVGAPGSFTVNAIDDAKATIATAVCTFDWIVIG
jgi:hypothetical protein